MMAKYMFLYLMTGGGHYAPAKAVAETIIATRGSDVGIILHDGLSGTKPFVRRIIEDGYKNSVNKALWFFELLYALGKLRIVSKFTTYIGNYLIKPAVQEAIIKNRPDKIIIYHYILIRPVKEILHENSYNIPVIVVVTDPFTAPLGWFLDKNQKFIVFSDTLKEKCISMGISDENVKVFPFVLSKKFSESSGQMANIRLRNELGFIGNVRIVLILGGADGMPGGLKIFKSIVTSGINAGIIFVCGRDTKLFNKLSEIKSKHKLDNVRIFGFIDFIHHLIQISDVVITKAGPSVCMETLLSEKVPVINNYIWEQERGNMEYICSNGMGIYQRNIHQLPDVIKKLLNDNSYYNHMIRNIRLHRISNGADQVSEYILNYN